LILLSFYQPYISRSARSTKRYSPLKVHHKLKPTDEETKVSKNDKSEVTEDKEEKKVSDNDEGKAESHDNDENQHMK